MHCTLTYAHRCWTKIEPLHPTLSTLRFFFAEDITVDTARWYMGCWRTSHGGCEGKGTGSPNYAGPKASYVVVVHLMSSPFFRGRGRGADMHVGMGMGCACALLHVCLCGCGKVRVEGAVPAATRTRASQARPARVRSQASATSMSRSPSSTGPCRGVCRPSRLGVSTVRGCVLGLRPAWLLVRDGTGCPQSGR